MNEVICGDCEKVLIGFLKSGTLRFDLIVADPPFNKGKDYGEEVDDSRPLEDYYSWCERWIQNCFDVLKPNGSFYVYCPSQHLGQFQVMMSKYGVWQNTIVWGYTNPTPDKGRFPKAWSCFLFYTKSNEYYFNPDAKKVAGFKTNPGSNVRNTRLSDLWLDVSRLTGGYLAQREVLLKPATKQRICIYQLSEELLERIILSSSQKGDLILDLFAHSGTTSIVAKKLKRHSVAVEISEFYCELLKKQLYRVEDRVVLYDMFEKPKGALF